MSAPEETEGQESDAGMGCAVVGVILMALTVILQHPVVLVFWVLGIGGVAVHHLSTKRRERKEREKADQEAAAVKAEAAAEEERKREQARALAEASRPAPPLPAPTAEEVAVAATARYEARLRIIDVSPMDETEKKAARGAAKRTLMRELDKVL